jgi:hypothetical protein
MSCEYCYKVNNKTLVESIDILSSGIKINISYWKKKNKAKLIACAFYDNMVGIEPIETNINYCPMCGRRLCGGVE